jgi:hypothetical protein
LDIQIDFNPKSGSGSGSGYGNGYDKRNKIVQIRIQDIKLFFQVWKDKFNNAPNIIEQKDPDETHRSYLIKILIHTDDDEKVKDMCSGRFLIFDNRARY